MLTLTRSVGETIRIGDDIEVHVVEVRGGTVRLGFKAPREVAIHREEVYRQIAEANLLAAQVTADSLGALAAFAPRRRRARLPQAGVPRRERRRTTGARKRSGRQICMAQGPVVWQTWHVSARVCPAPTRATFAE